MIYNRNHFFPIIMETIFKIDSKGKKRYVIVEVEKLDDGTANIIKKTGLVGGKESISTTHVKLGYDSALKRATTMWENQKQPPVTPMLAHKWAERGKHITAPFYVQPKIDGVRLLVSNKGGMSRTGKVIKGTETWGKGLKDGEYLDGECYHHDLSFEQITSLFRMQPGALEFRVFDYFDTNRPDLTFEERMSRITVETILVPNKKDLSKFHEEFMKQGYEGTMIREAKSVYEIGKRSNYLLKHKDFTTDEFKVIGVKEATGRDVGTPVWECETKDGRTFSVRPEGTQLFRQQQWEYRHQYIGELLTVRYQNLTEFGVPRFPVGVIFRDYE